MTTAEALEVLYPAAVPLVDYVVADDGSGQRVGRWDAARLGPEPTAGQLSAVTDEQVAEARDARHPERTDLRRQAAAAVAALDQYLAIADAATAAQVREQVKRLSQITRRVVVRLVQID